MHNHMNKQALIKKLKTNTFYIINRAFFPENICTENRETNTLLISFEGYMT